MMKLNLASLPATLRGIYGATKDKLGAHQLFGHPDLASAISRLESAGVRLIFSDIFRSAKGSLDARRAKPGLVQPPGYSAHNFGLAVDIDHAAVMKELRIDKKKLDELLASYGLYCHRTDHALASEAWHYNALGPGAERKKKEKEKGGDHGVSARASRSASMASRRSSVSSRERLPSRSASPALLTKKASATRSLASRGRNGPPSWRKVCQRCLVCCSLSLMLTRCLLCLCFKPRHEKRTHHTTDRDPKPTNREGCAVKSIIAPFEFRDLLLVVFDANQEARRIMLEHVLLQVGAQLSICDHERVEVGVDRIKLPRVALVVFGDDGLQLGELLGALSALQLGALPKEGELTLEFVHELLHRRRWFGASITCHRHPLCWRAS